MIFDTHAHYDDQQFDEDRYELLDSLFSSDICGIVNAAADLESSEKSLELANRYPKMYAAVGVHPENVGKTPAEECVDLLEGLIKKSKKVVAIGEIGLDYHFDRESNAAQKILFESQIVLAKKHGLPVLVHDREAHGDTLDILKQHKPKGIVHCFSGSLEMAREVIKLGMYLGIGGVVTFKNAKNLTEVVENIPMENIVLETDAPYLAPVPFRGKRCNSGYIRFVAEKISEIKKIEISQVYNKTLENARKIFNI